MCQLVHDADLVFEYICDPKPGVGQQREWAVTQTSFILCVYEVSSQWCEY